MLDQSYLIRGLDALSRAHGTDYFADGHRAAAIISAYFLCAEEAVEEGVPEAIAKMIDDHWSHTELCAPMPDETPDSGLLRRITGALFASIAQLRQAGHNVIFPSLALRAFHRLPETITPSRVDGICRLIEAFDTAMDIALDEHDEFPDLAGIESLAEFALREYLRSAEAFVGRGQGWTGHMLTFGRALTDLHGVGYAELARKGHHSFKLYVKRVRMGPLDTDRPRPEHRSTDVRPLERGYWESRERGDPGLGHCFKYPYGLYGLMALAGDADLERRCLEAAFRVF